MTTATKTRANKTARAARPKMTAEQAQTFDRISGASARQIAEQVNFRAAAGIHSGCNCEPYEDFFTFNRWIAQGQSVCKGEKAVQIASYVERKPAQTDAAPEPGAKPVLIPRTLSLFCRCQVKAIPAK